MPPLRERKDDISLLVEHFLQKHRVRAGEQPRITEDAMQMLIEYDWPGNVRQLENSIERAAVLAQGKVVSSEHLQLNDSGSTHDQMLTSALGRLLGNGGSLDDMIKEVRGRLIELALERNNGDRAAAARMLDVDERTLR
jgi:DNA-binding NtrC family response regulator